MQQGAAVGVRADDLLDLRAAQEADLVLLVDGLEVLFPGAQGLFLTGIEAHVAITVAEVGIDGVTGDAFLDDAGTQLADLEDLAQALVADAGLDLLEVMADAGHDLSAVAPGAAEAQVAGFEHYDVGDAFFRELQGSIDAGKPPPITTTSASMSLSGSGN